jgi:hypothetical protein
VFFAILTIPWSPYSFTAVKAKEGTAVPVLIIQAYDMEIELHSFSTFAMGHKVV